jgi:hypothetical protein
MRRRLILGALVTAVLMLALLGYVLSAVRWVRSRPGQLAHRMRAASARIRHTDRKESAHARTL